MHLIKYSPLFKSFISILPQRKWICIQNARSFDDFLIDVKTKTKTCEIGNLEDSLIRNRIVCSTDSKEMRERVLRDSELMLTKAANMVRAFEIPIIQVYDLESKTAADFIQNFKVRSNSDHNSDQGHKT